MNGQAEEGQLVLSGLLGLDQADSLVRLLRERITGTAAGERVEVDLSGVTDVDTAALQIFVAARRTAEQSGKKLLLSSANDTLLDRFRLAGLEFLCRS
ncbi:MAG: STAS domain-containing protein [Magnetococcales bacterium]|nr:STAS domain-containing protein [Magnetococcales bacterium]